MDFYAIGIVIMHHGLHRMILVLDVDHFAGTGNCVHQMRLTFQLLVRLILIFQKAKNDGVRRFI